MSCELRTANCELRTANCGGGWGSRAGGASWASRLPGKLVRLFALFASFALLAGAAGCADNEPALERGDRLWADSNWTGALAEYRLAVAQREDVAALARVAHAFVRAGETESAYQAYEELLEREPDRAGQAAADFLELAERARARGDMFGVATAVDAALRVKPDLRVPDLSLQLARHFADRGDPERALEYYQRALTSIPPDSAIRLYYEIAVLEAGRERCDVAVDYLRAFRTQAAAAGSTESRGPLRSLVTESRWHLGSCNYRLAQEARQRGDDLEAVQRFETVIRLGEPENLLDQALLEHAETLYGLGRYDEALESYRRVVERSPTRTGALVERARRRIDQIRFGRPDIETDTDTTGFDRVP